MGGWIKLYRDLLDKSIWQCSTPEQGKILITMLLLANHQEKKWEWQGKPFVCKSGQFITSLAQLAKKSGEGISVKNVRTAIERFENLGFLTNESAKTGRLITIVNWDVYQSEDEKGGIVLGKEVAKTRQRGGKEVATNKNVKNDKNEKNNKDNRVTLPYQQIADMYNNTCVSFPTLTKLSESRKKAIKARLNLYTVEDFQKLFQAAEESDFLKGRNDHNWSATFDWLIKDSNMGKVLDGNYRNKNSTDSQTVPVSHVKKISEYTGLNFKLRPDQEDIFARTEGEE